MMPFKCATLLLLAAGGSRQEVASLAYSTITAPPSEEVVHLR